MKKMNPVVHFEMPAVDRKRAADFYTKVFGWDMQILGPEMGNYILATTTDSTDKGPKNPGAINGGFFEKTKDKSTHYPLITISVDDIEEHIKKIKNSGGKVFGKPIDIPGVGLYVPFVDSEGNRATLLQPS